ncbi:MAG TPA: hypothetical protein VGO55_17970 [Allosphingosinicella sp.]|jgi:hypothetical protein|nr:hypothetical protein [Allosphingosinicella sp.]
MLKLLIAAAALAFAPAAAQAEQGGANPNARVCRAQPLAGSRLGARRICRSKAEWDEQDRLARGLVRDTQNRLVSPTRDGLLTQPNGFGPGGPR